MPLDIAYSLEFDDYIDADRAYDLYWSGFIKDNHAFICPGTDCYAQVTCANLYGDTQSMKVVPHFRVYGVHNENCEIKNKKKLTIIDEESAKQTIEKKTLDSSVVDKFILKRPDSYYNSEKESKNIDSKSAQEKLRARKISRSENLKQSGIVGNVYSVRTIVSRYIRYTKDSTLEKRSLNINGKDISYRAILKKIWYQKLNELPDLCLVYHGWAFIDKYDLGYRVKFMRKFVFPSGEEITPSAFLYNDLIDNYKMKNLVINRIKKIVSLSRPVAYVFIYGKPEVFESKKNGKIYVNFKVNNLDYIDVNVNSPL